MSSRSSHPREEPQIRLLPSPDMKGVRPFAATPRINAETKTPRSSFLGAAHEHTPRAAAPILMSDRSSASGAGGSIHPEDKEVLKKKARKSDEKHRPSTGTSFEDLDGGAGWSPNTTPCSKSKRFAAGSDILSECGSTARETIVASESMHRIKEMLGSLLSRGKSPPASRGSPEKKENGSPEKEPKRGGSASKHRYLSPGGRRSVSPTKTIPNWNKRVYGAVLLGYVWLRNLSSVATVFSSNDFAISGVRAEHDSLMTGRVQGASKGRHGQSGWRHSASRR